MKKLFFVIIAALLVSVSCSNDDEEGLETGLPLENKWGFKISGSTELPSEGGSLVIKTDTAKYLLGISSFGAGSDKSGWHNLETVDTVIKRENFIYECTTGPDEVSSNGMHVKRVSPYETHVTMERNTTGKKKRMSVNFAPIGVYANPSIYLNDIIIVQE